MILFNLKPSIMKSFLLQFNDTNPLIFVACVAIGIIVYFYFTRWVFAINEILRQNQEQIVVLKKIAEKLGVPASELITKTD